MMHRQYAKFRWRGFRKGSMAKIMLLLAQFSLHKTRKGAHTIEGDNGRIVGLLHAIEIRMDVLAIMRKRVSPTLPETVKGDIVVSRAGNDMGHEFLDPFEKGRGLGKLYSTGPLRQITRDNERIWLDRCKAVEKALA